MRLWVFFVTVIGSLSALAWMAFPPALEDPFALAPQIFFDLDALAVEEVAALKLDHIHRHPRYDLMVFGNSRMMPLSAQSLGLTQDRYFNATLSGHSIRSHILLLEELERLRKTPKVALIGLDNAEAQYYGNPYWPALVVRWRQLARDLWAGLTRADIGWRDVLKMARRHFFNEGVVIRNRLSWDRVRRGAGIQWNQAIGRTQIYPRIQGAGWLPDGSRETPAVDTETKIVPIPRPNANIVPGYLAYDFERLAKVSARTGMRVVVMELFEHPAAVAISRNLPSPEAAQTRSWVAADCARLGFDCLLDGGLTSDGGVVWRDIDHPPQAVLAPYVQDLLRRLGVI